MCGSARFNEGRPHPSQQATVAPRRYDHGMIELPDSIPPIVTISLGFDSSQSEEVGFDIIPRAGVQVLRFNSPNAARLRDISAIIHDLQAAAGFCDAYATLTNAETASEVVLDGLWMSALIIYDRCFNKGVRHGERLDLAVLDQIPGDARGVHEHFRALRSKLVAHSVNALEQTEVYAVVTDTAGDSREVLSVGASHLRATPMNAEGMAQLRRLAMAFYGAARYRSDQLLALVHQEVDDTTLDEIYALPKLKYDIPRADQTSRARSN